MNKVQQVFFELLKEGNLQQTGFKSTLDSFFSRIQLGAFLWCYTELILERTPNCNEPHLEFDTFFVVCPKYP